MYILLSFLPVGEISDWAARSVQIKIIIENLAKQPPAIRIAVEYVAQCELCSLEKGTAVGEALKWSLLQVRDFPFGFPLSGGAVGNSRFLSPVCPCCWIVVLLVINCSVTEILTQALGWHCPGAGRCGLSWLLGYFSIIRRLKEERTINISGSNGQNPRLAGGDQMHTQMSWLNT